MDRLRHFFWQHPEWWSVVICALAWLLMLPHAWQHIGFGAHHAMPFIQETQYWLLMVAAMMLPLILDAVRESARSSLWRRRHRANAAFLLGFFAPWLLFGLLASGSRQMRWTHSYAAPALGFAVAALWQLTPVYRRAVNSCHRRVPLAPVGWQADRDGLRFGATIGQAQVLSCWPLMLACMFAGHGLIAMAGGLIVGALEHWSFRPRVRTVLVLTLALAGYYLVLLILNSSDSSGLL